MSRLSEEGRGGEMVGRPDGHVNYSWIRDWEVPRSAIDGAGMEKGGAGFGFGWMKE